jgi:hypothetical protein
MCLNDVTGATVNLSKTCGPWFTYVNAVKKTSLEVYFLYLGKMEVYWIFKMCCIVSVLLPTKYCLFHNFIFFHSYNMFFVDHVKGKVIPLQAWTGPDGSKRLRIQDFKTVGT